jgi:hypothetical protein
MTGDAPSGTTAACVTCGDSHVIHTDRPGATSPRPCPSCSCTSCGTPYSAADGGCHACNEWDPRT